MPLGGRHMDGAWDMAPVRGVFFGMGGASVEEGVADENSTMNGSMAMLKGMAVCASSLNNS